MFNLQVRRMLALSLSQIALSSWIVLFCRWWVKSTGNNTTLKMTFSLTRWEFHKLMECNYVTTLIKYTPSLLGTAKKKTQEAWMIFYGREWGPLFYFADVTHPCSPAPARASFWKPLTPHPPHPRHGLYLSSLQNLSQYLHIMYLVKYCCLLLLFISISSVFQNVTHIAGTGCYFK